MRKRSEVGKGSPVPEDDAEAKASMELEKYQGQRCIEQVEAYREEGHPEHWGLYACGLIVRHHRPAAAERGHVAH